MTGKKGFGLGALVLLAGLTTFGCSKTAEGAADDASTAGTAIKKTASDAANSATDAGNKMAGAASAAGNKVADFTSDATMATTVTPAVKTAILADSTLNDPANKIDIDSKDKIVHIKGSVETNDQKKKASSIAADTLKTMSAPADLKVSNELTVRKH